MIIDNKLVFSDAQAVCNAGSEASESILNFGEDDPDLGKGTPLNIRFIVEETFAGPTSITIQLYDGATATADTRILVSTRAFLLAELTQGAYLEELKIPDHHHQYMRLLYVLDGANATEGKITAWISLDR